MLKNLLKWLGSVDTISLTDHIPGLKKLRQAPWETDPFPHMVIDNFFTESYAAEIRDYISESIVSRGLTEENDFEKFSSIGGYDAYNFTPLPSLTEPLRVFYCREWYELFKTISKFKLDENVTTTVHHHLQGSESGFVHPDYEKFGFRNSPFINQLNHWKRNSIYQKSKDSAAFLNQKDVIITRRALALLYYVDTTEWKEGDGGETGLYVRKDHASLKSKVAPLHNRLLVFQISPSSWHAFITNNIRERNSVIQWFHEPATSMDARLGISKELKDHAPTAK